jgi:FlgD Ig-like domain
MHMAGRLALVLAASLLVASASAATYTVTVNADSGVGSLRQAINHANAHAGPDSIIFDPVMSGQTIQPLTLLPSLTDPATTINGDINGDGAPDVRIDAAALDGFGSGLKVLADSCTIAGLSITNFPAHGVYCQEVTHCVIRSCHAGVNLAGTVAMPNLAGDLYLNACTGCTIGGLTPAHRNIVAGGVAADGTSGIFVCDSTSNTVVGNYVGLTRDGLSVLGLGGVGITLAKDKAECTGNTIGSTTMDGTANVLGGLRFGVRLVGCKSNTIVGNHIGLCADGNKVARITERCIDLFWGAAHNTIGGTSAGARNVLAGNAPHGIVFADAATAGNAVQGNYLGLNAAGTHQRRLVYGIVMIGSAGAQTIGGTTALAGNTITPLPPASAAFSFGVYLSGGGGGSRICHNRIGVMPDGTLAERINAAVYASAVSATITENELGRAGVGVQVYEAAANPRVFRNTFRHCEKCVRLNNDAHCQLGDLGNLSTSDDGGNVFGPSNTWAIYNETPNDVKAEGNSFGTTSHIAIDARIYDHLDDPALGLVDYDPLSGGVHPTGGGGPLALAAVSALPTRRGLEIVFSLSADAAVTVQVLNLGGRLVATPVADALCRAGTQRLAWTGETGAGARAPAGRYIVRITARGASGQAATALATAEVR